jgi:hypothetical protein
VAFGQKSWLGGWKNIWPGLVNSRSCTLELEVGYVPCSGPSTTIHLLHLLHLTPNDGLCHHHMFYTFAMNKLQFPDPRTRSCSAPRLHLVFRDDNNIYYPPQCRSKSIQPGRLLHHFNCSGPMQNPCLYPILRASKQCLGADIA